MTEYNPYKTWQRTHIEDDEALKWMEDMFEIDNPSLGGWDTETTGLHIKRDYAFLVIFGWINGKGSGRVFTFEPTPERMEIFHKLSQKLKSFAAWNTSYDLHMLRNTGFEYEYSNLLEGTAVARLCVEAKSARDGGDSMQLKDIGAKYVHPLANVAEKHIKAVKKELNAERIKVLTAALKQFPIPGETTPKGKQKFWGKGAIEDFLKDPTQDVDDLPENVRDVWIEWNKEYPEPTYYDIYKRDPEGMLIYAGDDVITMLEFIYKCRPTLVARKQLKTLERENRIILPFHRMEATGLRTDQDYLKDSRVRMKAYITARRNRLYELAGEKVTVNQHVRIAQIIKEKYNYDTPSADAAHLNRILKYTDNEELKELCNLVKELRTLEKWYSTYLLRILDITAYDGRFYTQINSCSAVSGRVGSDAQQFPKKAITDVDGNELFCPRRAFIPTGEGYDKIIYIDQSQVELRVQADYTIKVSGGDVNLCRAYMPFKCFRYAEPYDAEYWYTFDTDEARAEWDKYDDWLIEDGKPWTPTDVHSATTHNALLLLGYKCIEQYKRYEYEGNDAPLYGRTLDEDGFSMVRYDGKRVNFSKNYGVGLATLCANLDLPEHVGQAMIDGYEAAFPEVITYGKAVQKQHLKNGYVVNMYDRRYYLDDTRASYKLQNYLIQGTCADAMKEAIIGLDEYIRKNNLKTRMLIPVHDKKKLSCINSFNCWKPLKPYCYNVI